MIYVTRSLSPLYGKRPSFDSVHRRMNNRASVPARNERNALELVIENREINPHESDVCSGSRSRRFPSRELCKHRWKSRENDSTVMSASPEREVLSLSSLRASPRGHVDLLSSCGNSIATA
jgi:hypothetical protein